MDHYTISPHGPWRLFTAVIPPNSTAVGTIKRCAGDSGALVQLHTGLYVQVNASVIRTLDQHAVQKAL